MFTVNIKYEYSNIKILFFMEKEAISVNGFMKIPASIQFTGFPTCIEL